MELSPIKSTDKTTFCNFCKRRLSDDINSDRGDCGGDCLRCMAEVIEDPECIDRLKKLVGPDNITYSYDRHLRLWCITVNDAGGNQIGEADYAPSMEMLYTISERATEHGIDKSKITRL